MRIQIANFERCVGVTTSRASVAVRVSGRARSGEFRFIGRFPPLHLPGFIFPSVSPFLRRYLLRPLILPLVDRDLQRDAAAVNSNELAVWCQLRARALNNSC